jgi:hypothetical protein
VTAANTARGQRGSTAVELLVALAVLAVGLGGLATMHRLIAGRTGGAARLAEAAAVAEAALEETRRLRWTELEGRFGPAPIDVELAAASGAGDRLYARHLRVEPLLRVSADLFRVRVEVSWAEGGAALGAAGAHDRTLALEALRTRQEAL